MRYDVSGATDDWELLEIVKNGRRPCSDTFAKNANDAELLAILGELRLLRASGCPPDRTRGNPDTEKVGKCVVQHPQRGRVAITVSVLKAKPHQWRLYFHVKDQARKQVEFLYAVAKKRWERDPDDLKRCCRLLEDVFAGRAQSEPLYVPAR